MSVTSGGTAPKPCSSGGSCSAGAGSAGIVITLVAAHWPSSSCQSQIDADRSSTLTTTPTKPYFLVGSCAGRSSSTIWCSSPRSIVCTFVARLQVPEVQPVTVLAAEQQLGDDAVLDHRRRAPLRGDGDVLRDVPPEVVGQVLVAAVGSPTARAPRTSMWSSSATPPGPSSPSAAEAGHEDGPRAAVHGVRAGVAGPLAELLRAQHLHDRRLGRVVLGVEDVEP